MSDEKNIQSKIENENQELFEDELNDVAGGVFVPPILKPNLSSPIVNNTFTGGVKPPSISSSLIDGIKGE